MTDFWGESFLRDMHGPMVESLKQRSVLMEALIAEGEEQQRKDEEWLATLTPSARRRVLLERRARVARNRARWWLEENVTWRFARTMPPDRDDDY